MNLKLEIIIKLENDVYTITTPSFPNCSGEHETIDGALKKLNTSITKQISNNFSEILKDALDKKNYTEIITSTKKRTNFEHRVYDLLQKKSPFNKEIIYKHETSESTLGQIDFFNILHNEPRPISDANTVYTNEENSDTTEKDTFIEKKVFLYPLSLN
ncbi:MAG: hypothetical protein VW378_03940 [bacterium]